MPRMAKKWLEENDLFKIKMFSCVLTFFTPYSRIVTYIYTYIQYSESYLFQGVLTCFGFKYITGVERI